MILHRPNPILDLALARERESTAANRSLAGGIDLAFVHDACAYVVIEHHIDRVEVIDCDFRQPRPGEPFDPVEICALYAERLAALGCYHVAADQHYLEVVRREMNEKKVKLYSSPNFDAKSKAWILARDYTRKRVVSMPKVVADHLSKVERIARAGGGFSIQIPRVPEMGHCDLAPAFVNAVWLDAKLNGRIGEDRSPVATYKGRWDCP